jgi:outer membrane lipoprotein-sorting protein
MTTKHVILSLMMATALTATGCGQPGATQVDTSADDAPVTTLPAREPAPAPGAQVPGQVPGQPPQALAAMQRAWAGVRTLSATYDLMEKGTKGSETANVKFYFKKPGDYRYEVSKHTSSIKNGSKSVFNTRTRKIQSRLAGALSFLPINGTLDDERSKSTRDYTLDQTDYATQTELLLKPGASVTQRAPNVLELARPTMYPGVETLRVTLDARALPATFELVEKGQVVYRKRITGLQLNPTIGSDKFSL